MTRIAIVGMACRYPDATSPRELWENAIAGRRAFRRLPDVRMRLEDYWDADPAAPDRFYARNAAVIEGYEFDRVAYKIAGSTYRSTDLTHWLALDVAARALADAGFPMAEGLPRERTGVIIGNSLTGEFSRANQLRLRWPFVRRMVAAALKEQDWDDDQLGSFLDEFEATFKSPFPEIDEDTLAGGLSNTIAGRICNHFDFKGGGYTVDGACSSSLLSVATACKGLVDGELDVVVAGGVDLSIDPFEIIGFAKTGALARTEMRVYDRGSNGFWPGEGCGMVVLMREAEAVNAGHRVYATIAGWGISSDGKGGITRPEISGYQLALRRAYERAGFGIETVEMFEGHGTGTKVGDETELRALSRARTAAGAARPAAISSIKGMIGHTKAAAGVAGLIKAAMAVHHEMLPPTIGCVEPHEVLEEKDASLRVLRKAEAWPDDAPLRVGITAMGFGGINTHVVLENDRPQRVTPSGTRLRALASSAQDAELLLVDAGSPPELRERLQQLLDFVPSISYAQLADLAATLHRELRDLPFRAAVVVQSPEDAERRLRDLSEKLEAGEVSFLSSDGRTLLGHASGPGRLGFLFPGQGSGRGTSGGALSRRFAEVEEAYAAAALPAAGDMIATHVAQPRIVTGSLAGLKALSLLGLEASVAVGHSLGEISALHWAGATDASGLLRIAATRGRTMSEHSASGTMAGIAAGADAVAELFADLPVVIAGYNAPEQTVVAGSEEAIATACARAQAGGITATQLPVSHAFHSPLVAPAADAFGSALSKEEFRPVARRVISTVTGELLTADTDVKALLHRQITDPVLFQQAVALAAKEVSLFVEVGPGRVLTGLASAASDVPAVALDTDDESIAGLLRVVGAAYVTGSAGVDNVLFHNRLIRPLQVGAEFKFFASPCEAAPPLDIKATARAIAKTPAVTEAVVDSGESSLDLLLRLAAERAELPLELVRPDSRLLDDLHLSSITVGQIVNQVAQRLGLPAALAPTNFATATVTELAGALSKLAETAQSGDADVLPVIAGAGAWTRGWTVDYDEAVLPATPPAPEVSGKWQLFAPAAHPLAGALKRALENAQASSGVLVCLPEKCEQADLESALQGAQAALRGSSGDRFVLVQHGRGAAGLAKTLRLEAPHLRTTVVHVPAVTEAVEWIVQEVAATSRFSEAFYDRAGTRRVPVLRVLPAKPHRSVKPLSRSDVLLVTGGGKGITAECAIALATDSRCKLGLIGRSNPDTDAELMANLERMRHAGLKISYAQADVTDPAQVQAAVAELTAKLGPVTAILHGAARNEPAGLSALDMTAVRAALAPKVDGLQAVFDAVAPEKIRLLLTLGSIIGRAGLRGEAHYAVANEWMAGLTREFGEAHPGCRAICLEWSVWSGIGMGEKLSVVESLSREGVTPVTPDEGVAMLRRIAADPLAPEVVVISGRTQGIDTLRYEATPLPLLRFVERPLVRYPKVELVTEVSLSAGTDLYLPDHLLDGDLLFPAVLGMEAMAQVATAMMERDGAAAHLMFEDVQLLRPIVIPPEGTTDIRIAALAVSANEAEVVIRSSETNFAADHFRAKVKWHKGSIPVAGVTQRQEDGCPTVPLEPMNDLYRTILFQGGRFQRLRRYHRAAARYADADLATLNTNWFAAYLPGQLLLGDPGVRDALMHGNQVCVPDATLLPVGIERIYTTANALNRKQEVRYCATERHRDGDTYTYDVAVHAPSGKLIERWDGLQLRAVRKQDGRGPWVPTLLGSYLERALEDMNPNGPRVAVAVEPHGPGYNGSVQERRAQSTIAVGRALGTATTIRYRPDGRPETGSQHQISLSHGAGVTMCVAAQGIIGCDVEPVVHRSNAEWRGLIGPHAELADLLARNETFDRGATRVWTAMECLQKAGLSPRSPMTLLSSPRPGWTIFGSGSLRVACFATELSGAVPAVFAILASGGK